MNNYELTIKNYEWSIAFLINPSKSSPNPSRPCHLTPLNLPITPPSLPKWGGDERERVIKR